LDGDAALDKILAGLVEQYAQTKHILVEDVISLGADTTATTAAGHKPTDAALSLGAAAYATAGKEPLDADVFLGAATAKQEAIAVTVLFGAIADGTYTWWA
jgi:hypothetical protein